MNRFELRLPGYEGPLEKLLELIEGKTLDINQISLAVVTDDFLKYLEEIGDAPPAILADFISVASRLILIKSKALLPSLVLTQEEEEDIHELEARIILYQKLKGSQKYVEGAWKSARRSFSRPYFLELGSVSVFHPGNNLSTESLREAIAVMYEGFRRMAMETETIVGGVVTLEDKMREIVNRIESYAEMSLRAISEGKSKGEAVVAFLAILHLAREQLIRLEQSGRFSDIIIRKSSAGTAEDET